MNIKETLAASILNKSKIYDYCVNPYTGCQVNCRYCYARLFMGRYSGHKEPWGEFVDAKINAPEVLKRQLKRARRGTVWVSSVCDPYQPLEAKYGLTRRCLEELVKSRFPVCIQTKSKLVLRDLDLFRAFEEIEVGFSISTNDEGIAKAFEPGAAPVSERIKALERIHSLGIRTYAFIGPLLPGNPEKLVAALSGLVDKVFVDRMNYLSHLKSFYRQLGLDYAMEDQFFLEYKTRLVSELQKRKMASEIVF